MITPNDPAWIAHLIDEFQKLGFYHSIELPDGTVIPGIQPLETQRRRLAQFPIPADLRGKRVLDIGAWDGWFSFEMERRGAEVVAVDNFRGTKFSKVRDLLGSKAEHVIADVCFLTPEMLGGRFDIVLFFGVLYHVKHPLLALERVCDLATEIACVESHISGDESGLDSPPVLEFFENAELAGQFDNWFSPNLSCLMALCRTAGFPEVEFRSVHGDRAHVFCRRRWTPPERESGPAPVLYCVENSVTKDFDFSCRRDDYLTAWFLPNREAAPGAVKVEVSGFGTAPVHVVEAGGAWQANCKLPFSLAPGPHDVRLRVGESPLSAPLRIVVDAGGGTAHKRDSATEPRIRTVLDGVTFTPGDVHRSAGMWVSVWASDVGPDVLLCIDGNDVRPQFTGEPDSEGVRQLNARLPLGLVSGEHELAVRNGELESAPVRFQISE